MKVQECSTPGCTKDAAFRTRSRPAWCVQCIDGILREGGLEPAEPFTSYLGWRLTTCITCGVQAHYRLEYVIGNNEIGQKTCRACFWKAWRNRSGEQPGNPRLASSRWPEERIIKHLADYGLELVTMILDVVSINDPVVTRCKVCGRISAERLSDVSFGGCDCSKNTRNSHPTSPRAGRVLFNSSDSPALQWWDHEKNDPATLATITVRATRPCSWRCPECGLRFQAKVNDMAQRPSCPDCMARRQEEWRAEYERFRSTAIADVPELLQAWADEDDPMGVMVVGGWPQLRRFRCAAGHYPRISPIRFLDSGCPHCRAARTAADDRQYLAEVLPEIASQWHPTLNNGRLNPQNVVWNSKRKVWWRSECCGYEWQQSVRDRDKYQRLHCPQCRTILDSLAWQDPGLAAEWSPSNPVSAWHVRPHTSTNFLPEWICSSNERHVWRAPLSGRSNGSECPECRESGKSKVELDHHQAAIDAFGNARSGIVFRDKRFRTRSAWTTDISAKLGDRYLIIEYDGVYWHSPEPKRLIDIRKTEDLLAAGHTVVRLREDALLPLPIDHERYHEIRVYSVAPQPHKVMEEIQDWLSRAPVDRRQIVGHHAKLKPAP